MFRKKVLSGQLTCGSWCQIGHPANAEILARAGFEWMVLDCEHGECEDADIGNFCRSLNKYPCDPVVRVRENAVMPIRRALDLGASGVIVPLVNTAADAARAVAAAKYPPDGIRGFAFQRANAWGVDFQSYVQKANAESAVIVMIESREAVDNIDSILEVDGVDGVLIGPYDMSGSFGIVGQTQHRLVQEACSTVASACRRHGKAAGMHIVTPTADNVNMASSNGFSMLALGMDTVFLANGANQASRLREND